MNYKKYILDQLEVQNLYYDANSSPFDKLEDERELTEKELETLMKRIGINQMMIDQKLSHIKNLLHLFMKHLIYTDYDKAEFVYSEVATYNDFLPYTTHNRLASLLKIRYFQVKKEHTKIKQLLTKLKKERLEFSPLEELLFEYLQGINEMNAGDYESANKRLDHVIRNTSALYGFEGEVYYHLSIVKTYLEEPSRAIYYGKKALDYLSQQYNYRRILHAQMSLAINCAYAKIYEDAIEYYEHLLRNSQLLNQKELLPHIYHNMGDLYFKMENYSLAIAYFNMAVNHHEVQNLNFASALFNLGLTELETKKNEDAIRTFERLADVSHNNSFKNYELYTEFYLKLLKSSEEAAHSFLESTVIPFTRSEPSEKNFEYIFSDMLVRYYKNKGQYKKAFSYITDEKYK
ncbi:tetratricopeptide repeat protein [Chryseomicrobium palamuruense]